MHSTISSSEFSRGSSAGWLITMNCLRGATADIRVRQAIAYAFDYTNFIDEILGNRKYGIDFGHSYAGAIVPGLPYYVPPSELENIPTYDLTKAKQLLRQSGQYDTPINIPIIIRSGETVGFTAAQMWAAALNSIDPNIVMTPVYIPLSTQLSIGFGLDPIYLGRWTADYPHPSNMVDSLYADGYAWTAGWRTDYLNSTGRADQAAMFAQMKSLIQIADSATNATVAAQDYKEAEQIAINLYMYVYTMVPNFFWVVKPYMNGYQGQISYQQNPINGGGGIGLYFWWVKTCGSVQACSGRNVGP
jgi:peptide/nickel transport system substrate-binding protein